MSTSFLFFHGLTGSDTDFSELARYLSKKGHRVRYPLLLGHNSSVTQLSKVTLSAWLKQAERELLDFLEESGSESVIVGGLSFGGLLALYLSGKFPTKCHGAVLLAPPRLFRKQKLEVALGALSYLPDFLLNQLGIVQKHGNRQAELALPYNAYNSHSIGAAARIVQLRKAALRQAPKCECPLLIVQDPTDHHVEPRGVYNLVEDVKSTRVSIHWLAKAMHELPLGPQYEMVFSLIDRFAVDLES